MSARRLAKGPPTQLLQKFRFFKRARPEHYGGSMLKALWGDSPDLAVSLGVMATSLVVIGYCYQQERMTKRYTDRPYKKFYTVYRPDDTRIERLKMRPSYYNNEGTIPDYRSPIKDYAMHN